MDHVYKIQINYNCTQSQLSFSLSLVCLFQCYERDWIFSTAHILGIVGALITASHLELISFECGIVHTGTDQNTCMGETLNNRLNFVQWKGCHHHSSV